MILFSCKMPNNLEGKMITKAKHDDSSTRSNNIFTKNLKKKLSKNILIRMGKIV